MSIEAARKFHARMQTDEAFRTAVTAASTAEAVRMIAAAAGIGEFTTAESESVAAELSDENLGQVAGGVWGDPHENLNGKHITTRFTSS